MGSVSDAPSKKIISGVKLGGQWFYAIPPDCQMAFELYMMKTSKMHKTRGAGTGVYQLGFPP